MIRLFAVKTCQQYHAAVTCSRVTVYLYFKRSQQHVVSYRWLTKLTTKQQAYLLFLVFLVYTQTNKWNVVIGSDVTAFRGLGLPTSRSSGRSLETGSCCQLVNSVSVGMDADDISSVEKEKEELNALLVFFCFDVAELRPHQEILLALFKCGRSLFLILFFLQNIFIFFQFQDLFPMSYEHCTNSQLFQKLFNFKNLSALFFCFLFFNLRWTCETKMILEPFSLSEL